MSAEDELQNELQSMLGARAAAASQLQMEMKTLASSLGTFRRYLVKDNDFTAEGAENLALELFIRWLDTTTDEDDGS